MDWRASAASDPGVKVLPREWQGQRNREGGESPTLGTTGRVGYASVKGDVSYAGTWE